MNPAFSQQPDKPAPKRLTLQSIFAVMLSLVLVWQTTAFAAPKDVYAVKAAFILNFAMLTEWPETAFQAEETKITLCVVGTGSLPKAFQALSGKKIGQKSLRVVPIAPDTNLPDCQIIFFRHSVSTEHIVRTLAAVRGLPVLTIGEKENVTSLGGAMHFYTLKGKLRFAINPRIITTHHLKLSSRLLKIATIIRD